MFEIVEVWLEFLDDVCGLEVEFEVGLNVYTQEFGDCVLFDLLVVEREFDVWMALRVECCVCGFGFVWGEVVALEVVDERGEICLCFVLKLFDRWC